MSSSTNQRRFGCNLDAAIIVALIAGVATIIAASIGAFGPLIQTWAISRVTLQHIAASPSPIGKMAEGNIRYQQIILGGPSTWGDNLDTLSDPNGWSSDQSQHYGCGFLADRKYHAYEYINGYVEPCFVHNKGPLRNFGYQANMTVERGSGGGLVFCAATPSWNTAMYRFDVRPTTQTFDILVQQNNGNRTNRSCDTTGHPYCTNSLISKTGKNTLAVIAQGSSLYFYINGQCIAQITDTASSFGFIGVFAVDAGPATDVIFDSTEIWNLSS